MYTLVRMGKVLGMRASVFLWQRYLCNRRYSEAVFMFLSIKKAIQ